MIQSVSAFINYFGSVRRRTLNYVNAVPSDKIDWSPKEGELTCGNIIRHMGSAEKMFSNVSLGRDWHYYGHEQGVGSRLEDAIKAWRILLAMAEHEVHHRSQLAVYLALMGVEPPQIYGLKIEDIIELSTT